MLKTILGKLEELILLVVAASREDDYGVTVCEQLQVETGRSFTISAVLYSQVGGATAERRGRRERLFALTLEGGRVLLEIQQTRLRLWWAILENKL